MELKINIPLLIRLLELSREELKQDIQIHLVVEQMMKMKQESFSMADYPKIISVLAQK